MVRQPHSLCSVAGLLFIACAPALGEWGINLQSHISMITPDGASNNKRALTLLRIPTERQLICVAHRIQCSICPALGLGKKDTQMTSSASAISKILKKVRCVNKMFKKSNKMFKKLEEICATSTELPTPRRPVLDAVSKTCPSGLASQAMTAQPQTALVSQAMEILVALHVTASYERKQRYEKNKKL